MRRGRPPVDRFRSIPDFPLRLAELINTFASVSAAATAIERSEGAVRKWLRAESQPSASDIRLLCELSGFTAEWLLFGTDVNGRCERENRVLGTAFRLVRH